VARFALDQGTLVRNPVVERDRDACKPSAQLRFVRGRNAGKRRHEGLPMKPVLAAMSHFALVVAPFEAHAQMAGDVAKGRQFAQQICPERHTVEKGQHPSPNGQAPNFETIAKTPGMTTIALTAVLRTSHRNMPNIIIAGEDLRDVVAYVLSLQ
jgi:cytochrome c